MVIVVVIYKVITDRNKVTNHMEDGEYFIHAMDWYTSTYLRLITERAMLFLLTCFMSILLCITSLSIMDLFPIVNTYPFVKSAETNDDEYSIMTRVSSDIHEPAQQAIAKYLIEKYVHTYQSYSYINLKTQSNIIENNSTRRLYSTFKDYMDVSNPLSPLVTLKRNGRIAITVKNISLDGADSRFPDTAYVTIDIKEIFENEVRDVRTEKLKLTFTLSNVLLVSKGIIPLEFMVRSYTII